MTRKGIFCYTIMFINITFVSLELCELFFYKSIYELIFNELGHTQEIVLAHYR